MTHTTVAGTRACNAACETDGRNGTRWLARTLFAAGLALAAAPASALAAGQDAPNLLSYVRVGEGGVQARNLADVAGVSVRKLESGTPLAVHGERAGWLDVEAPGGFRVWVYGQFVKSVTGQEGMVQITGDSVRMRPLPSSGPESMPLRQLFARGEKVRLIGRDQPGKPLAQDWVQVWSPPGARAWVKKSETVALEAGVDGSRLWAQAVTAERGLTDPTAKLGDVREAGAKQPAAATTGKAPAKSAQSAELSALLSDADRLLREERRKEDEGLNPDYAMALAAYQKVLDLAGEGTAEALAIDSRMTLARSYQTAYELKQELERERQERLDAISKREVRMTEAASRTAFEGRFDCRGWLEPRTVTGKNGATEDVWVVRWAGSTIAEVVCFSGRYDLSVFKDYELGIRGHEVRGALAGAIGASARPRQIDVSRIEVLAGRK